VTSEPSVREVTSGTSVRGGDIRDLSEARVDSILYEERGDIIASFEDMWVT